MMHPLHGQLHGQGSGSLASFPTLLASGTTTKKRTMKAIKAEIKSPSIKPPIKRKAVRRLKKISNIIVPAILVKLPKLDRLIISARSDCSVSCKPKLISHFRCPLHISPVPAIKPRLPFWNFTYDLNFIHFCSISVCGPVTMITRPCSSR